MHSQSTTSAKAISVDNKFDGVVQWHWRSSFYCLYFVVEIDNKNCLAPDKLHPWWQPIDGVYIIRQYLLQHVALYHIQWIIQYQWWAQHHHQHILEHKLHVYLTILADYKVGKSLPPCGKPLFQLCRGIYYIIVCFNTNPPVFYKSYYPIPHRPVNFPVIKYGFHRIHSGVIESSLDVKEDTKCVFLCI